MLHNKSYSVKSQIVTNEILTSYINKFWNEVFTPLLSDNKNKHLMILCKIQYSNDLEDSLSESVNGSYKTLSPLRRVEIIDKELFTEFLIQRLGLINDSYSPLPVDKIVFTYLIKEGKITQTDRLLLQDIQNNELVFHEFNKLKLPVSMNPQDYGKVEVSNEIEEDGIIYQRYIVSSNKYTYKIDMYDSPEGQTNIVRILGQIDLTWTDYKLDETDTSHFKREIGKTTIHFLDGNVILQKKQLNAKTFIKTRNKYN